MTSSAIYNSGVTSHSHMIDIEDTLGAMVTGRILNDHYDSDRYVSRRAMFLGNTYRNRDLDIFEIARSDADQVFDCDTQKLSVQEVERREKVLEIEPLSPLPTTENTQTLDDFQSFPAEEWTSAASTPLYIDRSSNSPRIQVNSDPSPAVSRVAVGSSLQHPNPGEHSTSTSNMHGPQQAQATIQARYDSANEAANTTMALNGSQQTLQGSYSGTSSSPLQDSSFSSSIAVDSDLTIVTSPMSTQDNSIQMQLEYSNPQGAPDQDLAQQIINALGTEKAKQASGYYAWEASTGVVPPRAISFIQQASQEAPAAMSDQRGALQKAPPSTLNRSVRTRTLYTPAVAVSSRGIPLPVKTQSKPEKYDRGQTPEEQQKQSYKKRPRSVPPASSEQTGRTEQDLNVGGMEEAENPPPAKKPKLILKVSTKPSPAQNMTTAPPRPRRKKTKPAKVQAPALDLTAAKLSSKPAQQASAQVQATNDPETATRPRRTQAPSRKAAANSIESVIAGDSLPQSKVEAEAAAKTRVDRLVANYNAIQKSRKHRQVRPGEEIDAAVMPEHFYVGNLVKKDDEGVGQEVRCVCGATRDDFAPMVQCDGCDVWQHMKCVGRKVNDTGGYQCHVCDSWTHRERIAKMRKANVLS